MEGSVLSEDARYRCVSVKKRTYSSCIDGQNHGVFEPLGHFLRPENSVLVQREVRFKEIAYEARGVIGSEKQRASEIFQ